MKKRTSLRARLVSILLAVLLISLLPCTAFAATANDAVKSDTTGVVQIRALYLDNENIPWTGYTGTAFLINEEHILTCNHVFDLSNEDLEQGMEDYGWTEKQIREHSRIEIVVMRDVTIQASIVNQSAVMDFAILKLSQKLYDRTYLPLRNSSEVQQTESIYSLGFPGGVSYWQDTNTYTSDDVTITAGRVNKLNTVGTVDYIQHGALITGGNSGGPLVDENGAVIGINVFTTGSEFESDYSYAVAIDQPKQVLDSLGISYSMSGEQRVEPEPDPNPSSNSSSSEVEPEPAPEVDKGALSSALAAANLVDLSTYEQDENAAAFDAAISSAQRVLDKVDATQEEIDSALAELTMAQGSLVEKTADNTLLLIIVAAVVAVAVIVAIIILVVANSKKKNNKGAKPAPVPHPPVPPYTPPMPAKPNYPAPSAPSAGETSVLGQGGGETTILGQGSSETTVLNRNLGSLVRTKTGEKIALNTDSFVIGRERTHVNYCVSDNTSVGRTHARISTRGNSAYIADMQSKNGTYLNGVKLNPGQELGIKDGDKITLADEEFVYRAH